MCGHARLGRGVVLAACILASIGSVVGVIGSIVDGIASAVLDSLVACVSSTGIVSGDTSNYDDLYYSCYYSSYYNHDCSCSSPDSYTCYFYDGPLAVAGCDNILVKYTESLKAAVAFDVLATIAVFAFSVITCISLCAVSSSGTKTTVVGAGGAGLPPQQIVMVQPQQPIQVPVQYAQVPGQYPPQAYAQATPQGYAGVPVNVQYPPPGQAGVPANVQYPPQGYAEGYGQKA